MNHRALWCAITIMVLLGVSISYGYDYETQALPNLYVDKIRDLPSSITPGQAFTFNYDIGNSGASINGTSFYNRVYIDGNMLSPACTRNNIPSGEPRACASPSITLTQGPHTIEVRADTTNKISESNENDNSKSVEVYAGTPPNQYDLVPSSYYFSPSSPTTDDNIIVRIGAKNNGPDNIADTFRYALLIDNNYYGALSKSGLNSDSTTSYYIIQYSDNYKLSAGTHELKIVTDYYDDISETNEYNNEETHTVTVTSPPNYDLIVSNVELPGSIVAGESFNFNYYVKNIGDDYISDYFGTTLYIDGVSQGTIQRRNVGSGSTTDFTKYNVVIADPGQHTIRIVTDSGSAIDETDEYNNEWNEQIYVNAPAPEYNIIPLSYSASPSNPTDADPITLTYGCKNEGPDDITDSFTIGVSVETESKGTCTINGLAAGDLHYCDTNQFTLTDGDQFVETTVDKYGNIDEIYEADNVKTESISVLPSSPQNDYDILPAGITTSPTPATAGESFTLYYPIKNQGESDITTSFTNRIYIDGVDKGTCDISTLNAKQIKSCNLPSLSYPGGDYAVRIVTDENNYIEESIEGNNAESYTLHIEPGSCADMVCNPYCSKDYTYYYYGECIDGQCVYSTEQNSTICGWQSPIQCPIPDGSSADCDCDDHYQCPSSHPYCEEKYPMPISSGYDACLAEPPQYCGDGICNDGETEDSCRSDCGNTIGTVHVTVYDIKEPKLPESQEYTPTLLNFSAYEELAGAEIYVNDNYKGSSDNNGRLTFGAVLYTQIMIEAFIQGIYPCSSTSFIIDSPDTNVNLFCNYTLPTEKDSDKDGFIDSEEMLMGTNPEDNTDNYDTVLPMYNTGLCAPISLSDFDIPMFNDIIARTKAMDNREFNDVYSSVESFNKFTSSIGYNTSKTSNQDVLDVLGRSTEIESFEIGPNVILIVEDYEGTTYFFPFGANCTGYLSGLAYGGATGLKDDLTDIISLADLVVRGLWYEFSINIGLKSDKEVMADIGEFASKVLHGYNNWDTEGYKMVVGVFNKGKSVLKIFDIGNDGGDERDYREFQWGFFTGYYQGYVMGTFTGIGYTAKKALTLFRKGIPLSEVLGKSLLKSKQKVINTFYWLHQSYPAKVIKSLAQEVKIGFVAIKEWSEDAIDGLTRLFSNKKDYSEFNIWVERKGTSAVKEMSNNLERFIDDLSPTLGSNRAIHLANIIARSDLEFVESALLRWDSHKLKALAETIEKYGEDFITTQYMRIYADNDIFESIFWQIANQPTIPPKESIHRMFFVIGSKELSGINLEDIVFTHFSGNAFKATDSGKVLYFKPDYYNGNNVRLNIHDRIIYKLDNIIYDASEIKIPNTKLADNVNYGDTTGSGLIVEEAGTTLDRFTGTLTESQKQIIKRRALHDYLFGKHDCHNGNIAVNNDGRISFIDNEMAFDSLDFNDNFHLDDMFNGNFGQLYSNDYFNELKALWNSNDAGKKAVLDTLGPEFQRLTRISREDFDAASIVNDMSTEEWIHLQEVNDRLFGTSSNLGRIREMQQEFSRYNIMLRGEI